MATQAFNADTGVSVGSSASLVIDANRNANFANVSANLGNFSGNVSTNSFFVGDGGYLTNISAGGSSLNVSQYTTGTISNIVSNVDNLLFDTTTGFSVTDLGNGDALIQLGSSFKTWEVTGQTSLVAVGEDTVQFIAGSGITITTNANVIPQQITFTANLGNISDNEISNGTSNVSIPTANGNVFISVNGNANVAVVTSTGMNVAGTANITGNANVGNLGFSTGEIIGTGNITAGFFIGNGSLLTGISGGGGGSNISNGNSNVNIPLANGDINFSSAGNANVVVITGTGMNVASNVTAAFFIGNGSQLTGITASSSGSFSNGNSNVSIPVASGNVLVSVSGTANVATFTNNSMNVAANANITGNLVVQGTNVTIGSGTGGNISGANAITSNSYTANGALTGNANVATVTGALGIRAIASTYTDNSAAASATIANVAIHAFGTPTLAAANSTVTFTNAATFYVAAGPTAGTNATITNSYSILTAGNISAPYFIGNGSLLTGISGGGGGSSISNGNSNVNIATANGNVTIAAVGNTTMTITGTGVNVSGTGNFSSNLNAGNVNAGNLITANYSSAVLVTAAQPNITSVGTLTSLSVTGNVTVGNLIGPHANGNSNVYIATANGNVTIAAVGNTTLTVTGTGVNIAGTLNAGSGNIFTSGNATFGTVSTPGNLSFSSNGQRILGDFTNSPVSNRLMFQSSVANGNTSIFSIPNGTGNSAGLSVTNNSDVGNSGFAQLAALSTDIRIQSNIFGTGTYLPMTFYTSATERVRIDINGNVGIGNTAPTDKLSVTGTVKVSGNLTAANLMGSLANGNSNVYIATANGNVTIAALGNTTMTITGTGVNVAGTMNASGNIAAAFFIGNGSQLTGIAGGGGTSISNGNSNVSIATANGNINFSATGNSNVMVITGTGANINGTANIIGNVALSGANVALGSVSNVRITGGANGYVLSTDGSGTLSWTTPSSTTVTVDSFTGNGVQTAYTLSVTPTSVNYVFLAIGGVSQPRSTYSLAGNVVTVSSAPANTVGVEFTSITGGTSGSGGGGNTATNARALGYSLIYGG